MNGSTEIRDTLKAAKTYLNHLQTLNKKIQNAEQQICETSRTTEDSIKTTFNKLLSNLTQIITNRQDQLLKRVQNMKQGSLIPLEECRGDISLRIEKTQKLISEGECLLNGSIRNLEDFNQKSSLLGSLPEIPELKDVPYITFNVEPTVESELTDICSQLGEISKIAPVQISQTSEKPGAILVEWQVVDDDHSTDIQEFRLQRAFGNVIAQEHLIASFSDCFVGADTQFLVKELQPHQPYSFRVCCKFEGSNTWSPWSFPQVFASTIKHFSWANNVDYALSDENRIASPVKNSPSLLMSDGPQFAIDYSVEFTYLEFDGSVSTIGLLVPNNEASITDIKSEKQSHFAVDSTGEIFVDGLKKSTKLPQVVKGLKVCFTCESISNDKVRINIDSCDKRVTYDWQIHKDSKLYFAALLQSPNSKIMVE